MYSSYNTDTRIVIYLFTCLYIIWLATYCVFILFSNDLVSVILIIVTLLVVSVTSQTIEFDPSLNDTIYINVRT